MKYEIEHILTSLAGLKNHRRALLKPFNELKEKIEDVDEKIRSYEKLAYEYETREEEEAWLKKQEEPSIHWGEMSNIEILKKDDDTV